MQTFKAHGIDIVHLAEFHVDHTPEMNAERLALLKTLHGECRRLSGRPLPAAARRGAERATWAATGSACSRSRSTGSCTPKPGTPFEQKVDGTGHRVRRPQRRRRAEADGEGRRPDVDRPPADQSLLRLPGPLPRRRTSTCPTASSARRGRRCRPTTRSRGSGRACSTCSTTWPTGGSTSTCSEKWTCSRSSRITNSTAT